MIFSSIFAFSCKDDDYGKPCEDGKHTYGSWVYQNDATCLKDGTEVRTCTNSYCNAKQTRTKSGTKVASHSLSFVEEVQATCLQNGNHDHYKCSICNSCFSDANAQNLLSQDQVVIPKTEHIYDYESDLTVDVAPEKNNWGLASRHCKFFDLCGERTDITPLPPETEINFDENGNPTWTPNA